MARGFLAAASRVYSEGRSADTDSAVLRYVEGERKQKPIRLFVLPPSAQLAVRRVRMVASVRPAWLLVTLLTLASSCAGVENGTVRVLGLRLPAVDSKNAYDEAGVITVQEGLDTTIEVLGLGLTADTKIRLTSDEMEAGADCDRTTRTHSMTKHFQLASSEAGEHKFLLHIQAGDIIFSSHDTFRVCVEAAGGEWVHQGDAPELRVRFYSPLMPVWLMAVLVSILLCLSGLFSGLNLGLMALDKTELEIVIKTGSEREQEDAKAILPVRTMGNFLLCSLLLGNVLVNNSLTIMLDNLTGGGGLIAVIGSTMGIVIFGEIIPQALCSRHGLAVGAKTLIITKFFMLVTSPLSFPISKILDCILGEELGTVYDRERLRELVLLQGDKADLDKNEVKMLEGALRIRDKTVEEIMTPLADCYMLPLDATLDFDTISEIRNKGYSRIPVFDPENPNKIVYILLAKDLLFVDPEDRKPMQEVCKFYNTPFAFVEKGTPLNKQLDEFKTGEKGHLAMVTDPDMPEDERVIGLVTLEDIVEEIIQAEIVDETDIVIDNKTKKKRKTTKLHSKKELEFQMFMGNVTNRVEVSPEVVHAVLQFLTTSLPPFSVDNIKTDILKKLLNQDAFRQIKFSNEDDARENPILKAGITSDAFILIVEGKTEVQIGNEGYKFESGPFTSFGKQILEQVIEDMGAAKELQSPSKQTVLTWRPDCTITARTDVLYVKVKQATYRAALRASRAVSGEGGGLVSSDTVETHLETMATSQRSIRAQDSREHDPLINIK